MLTQRQIMFEQQVAGLLISKMNLDRRVVD